MRERLITFSYSFLIFKISLHLTPAYPTDTHQSDFPLLNHAPSPPDDNGIYKALQLWNLQNEKDVQLHFPVLCLKCRGVDDGTV